MSSHAWVRMVSIVVVLSCARASGAQTGEPAQNPPPDPQTPVQAASSAVDTGGGFKHDVKILLVDFAHLPRWENGAILAVGGGLAAAVHPWDDNLNSHLTNADWFIPGKYIGLAAVQMGGAALSLVVGKVAHKPKVAHLGSDLLRAQIMAQAMTYGLKYTVRRDRPDGSPGYSFPSGHASVTFATAAVLTRHLGWKGAVPSYILASYVATSRLYENRHFVSDVVFGAAVGIVAGRTATRPGHSSWAFVPVPEKGGMGILVQKTFGAPVGP